MVKRGTKRNTDKPAEKTTKRTTHFASRWKLNSYDNPSHKEFVKRLNIEELAWFNKFEDEYVRATFQGDDLHSPEQKKKVYDAQNTAYADVTSKSSDQIAAFQAVPLKKHASKNKYYTPADWGAGVLDPSKLDDLIDTGLNISELVEKFR